MSQIRGKNTKPEILLRKTLWHHGVQYRLHYKLPGRPDIVLVALKIAVFVDGCFWHGCPEHGVRPKTNRQFWDKKIQGNIQRDKKNRVALEKFGWKVLRFWEHEVEQSVDKAASVILKAVQRRSHKA
jgi:DNA mismatch endonuclease (patch repair protein)